MCLRAIKTKHYSCSAYLSSVSWAITLRLWLAEELNFHDVIKDFATRKARKVHM